VKGVLEHLRKACDIRGSLQLLFREFPLPKSGCFTPSVFRENFAFSASQGGRHFSQSRCRRSMVHILVFGT
jgi:hypothetical protein